MSFLKTFFKNYGLVLLQIATWFSKWGKHVAKKTVVPSKGCRSSERELLYIHAPSIWCTPQCIISCIRREIFFLSPILSLLWFFRKVFLQNLVVPWNFGWKSNWIHILIKNFTQSMTSIISVLTSVIDWGGEWFLKILCIIKYSPHFVQNISNKTICDGYVSQ